METDRADQRRAWQALRRSRKELAPLLPDNPARSVSFWTRNQYHRHQTVRGLRTGASVKAAVVKLTLEGMPEQDAALAVQAAVLKRFGSFASGWNYYCNSDGWLRDLFACDDELRRSIMERHDIDGLIDQIEIFRAGSGMSSPGISMLLGLAGEQNRLLNRMRSEHEHPAIDLLEHVYGMHPALARAVMLFSQAVPWWVYIVINVFLLVAGWIFWLALVDPQNAVFTNESVGGVGIGHYVFLPLFILGMLCAQGWLIIDSPRREKAWREWLGKYRNDW